MGTPINDLIRLDVVGPALAQTLDDDRWKQAQASLVAGGKSNLTFIVTSDAGQVVLRRPPSGHLLPRAHDMGREARVQRALAATPVPVPAILLVDQGDLIGVPFYVMAKVDGYSIRDDLPPGFAETPADRAEPWQLLCQGSGTGEARNDEKGAARRYHECR